jgi:hypothetical protein
MTNEELVAWTRKEATLSSKSTEFSATVINQMMNLQMSQVFEPIVANCRAGYWYHTFTRTLGVGNPFVRLPPRSCPAIEQVDISADGGANWVALKEALEAEVPEWMCDYGGDAYPAAYTLRGTNLYLLPAARSADCQLRVKVVVKPSTLVASQLGVGVVQDYDPDTRIVEVSSLPVDRLNSNAAMGGTKVVDIIEPRAQFELSLCDAAATVIDPTHVQIAAGHSLARIEVGDYLRFAGQSDWPQLPIGFHSLLGSATAVPIARQRDLHERADALSTMCSARLEALVGQLKPRVRVATHKPVQHQWR